MTVKLPAISNLGSTDKKKFIEYRKVVDTAIEQLKDRPDLFIQM